MVQNNSKPVQNGREEFERSNMIQYGINLPKKSSKWVQHNQVSWFSCQSPDFKKSNRSKKISGKAL